MPGPERTNRIIQRSPWIITWIVIGALTALFGFALAPTISNLPFHLLHAPTWLLTLTFFDPLAEETSKDTIFTAISIVGACLYGLYASQITQRKTEKSKKVTFTIIAATHLVLTLILLVYP